jgi:hypothetical protein
MEGVTRKVIPSDNGCHVNAVGVSFCHTVLFYDCSKWRGCLLCVVTPLF